LQDEDFFRKTAMPRREDILRCIDVTIMDRSAHTALPSSYSKTSQALRAGAVSRQEAPLALKYFGGQFVAVIEDGVDLACQARKPRRVLVLDPQAQDANSGGRSRTVHTYSLSTVGAQYMRENAVNAQKCAMRARLSREKLR
jgi:hypothetical protein